LSLTPQNITVPRAGFETPIEVGLDFTTARVKALDEWGNVLGKTDMVDTQDGEILTVHVQY
jgi:hypothetical protein